MKNRTIIGIICVAVALALAFVIAPLASKAAASNDSVTVIRAKYDIEAGSQIESDDIEAIEVGSLNLPMSVITVTDDIVGKYASCKLYTGDYFTSSKLSISGYSAEEVLASLDSEHFAISVTIDSFASGISAKLENGDIVSAIVTTDDGTFIPDELRYLRVITSTTASGIDKDKLTVNEDGTYDLPATITFLVNQVQAELLAEYESDAKMHFALVCKGSSELAKEILTEDKNE